jgi:hypothetical protein
VTARSILVTRWGLVCILPYYIHKMWEVGLSLSNAWPKHLFDKEGILNGHRNYSVNYVPLRTKYIYVSCTLLRPPLWSSGQSSWLQIQRSVFDSRCYQICWELVDLERGPLSLVSTVEELLGRKSSGSSLEKQTYGRSGSAALTTQHPSIRKSCH